MHLVKNLTTSRKKAFSLKPLKTPGFSEKKLEKKLSLLEIRFLNPILAPQDFAFKLLTALAPISGLNSTQDFNLQKLTLTNFQNISGATLTGFKKLLFNRVSASDGVLVPAYNRRKHARSHGLLIQNELRKLSKTFGYISLKTLNFWLGEVLANTYGTKSDYNLSFVSNRESFETKLVASELKAYEKLKLKPVVKFVNAVETQGAVLFWNCQISRSFYDAQQLFNHQKGKQSQLKPVLTLYSLRGVALQTASPREKLSKMLKVDSPKSLTLKGKIADDLNKTHIKTKRWVKSGDVIRSI